MKKLLIAMSAAAMFSLCAKADTTLEGSMDFSAYTPTVDNPATVVPDASDPGTQDYVFWTGDAGESSVVLDGEEKYLKVDTTAPLVRQTGPLGAQAGAAVEIGTGDITVSSKVQFTAADEAPEVTTGDKLIVWAKAPDEDDPESTTTNLMVTAKTAEGVVTNFVTDVLVDAETWYDLEIKAVATGSQNEGNASAAFTVSIAPAGSTPVAVTVGGQEVTFKSLLNDNVTGAQTIASIGFKGTGAVDNIVFAKNEGVVIPDVTVTVVAPEGVTLYDAQGVDLVSNVITTNAGATVKIYVADDEGTTYSSVSSSVGTVGAWDDVVCGWPITYTTTAENTAVTMTITVTEGGKTIITSENVTLSAYSAEYTDGLQLPTVTVVVDETTLVEGTDYTKSWVPAEITSAGGEFVVTVVGTGDYAGTVTKTFTVTSPSSGKAKVGDTEYDSGADFVAAATSGTVNTLPAGWTVDGNVVKDANGDTFATFPSFYTVTLTDGTLTLALTDAALTTAGDLVEVSVDTTFGLKVSASNTKLYYGLSSSATVNGTYVAPAKAGFTQGTGSALTLSAAKGEGASCFYKLYVTDVLPNE